MNVGLRTETILSGWAGGGGLDFGVHLALGDARTVCMLEREASCIALLVDRMEKGWLDPAPIWTDSRTFDGRAWRGRVSGFIGGPPCQPFSMAGQRRGAGDERNCWPDALRITGELRPEWCFFENVAGSCEYVADFVLPPLEGMGYKVEAGIFSAEEVGAPHLRERLFVLAVASNNNGWWRERRAEAGIGANGEWGRRPAGGSPELAVAAGVRWPEGEWWARGSTGQRESGGGELADVGNTISEGFPRRGHERATRANKVPLAETSDSMGNTDAASRRLGTGIPLFPPYRTGDDRWAAVLRDWPNLAPALGHTVSNDKWRPNGLIRRVGQSQGMVGNDGEGAPESGVRFVADGMAGLSRAQWLRIAGNGVVPLVAATAFRTLAGRMKGETHD